MRCLLILRMQRRVELLLLRSLCILMDLAGVYGMLRFVKRLLGVFSLFRVYSARRNRLLILVKLAGILPLLLRSHLRTGMGVAARVCPADGRLGLLRLDDIFLRRCRAHSIARDFAACHADESAAEKACAEAGVKALTGKIATGDLFVGDSETKAAIEAKCAPDCVEMEGAAVSQIAAKNDVPCVILRAMSDNADEDGHEVLVVKKFSIAEYVATATRIVAAMVEAL